MNVTSILKKVKPDSILLKPGVLNWVTGKPIKNEVQWGKTTANRDTNQWTTMLSEQILKETLEILNENPKRISEKHKSVNTQKLLVPDLITDKGVYECKCRTYSTTGTVGEKILGTPIKYIEIPKIYNKPLYIVCMAYQEIEADNVFNLFNPKGELKDILEYYKNTYNIHYVKFTDILKKIAN